MIDIIDMSKIKKSAQEWQSQLTKQQYNICREHGTERAFTGEYLNNKRTGKYQCICCGETLFDSSTKYDSGSGWPSFYAVATPDNIIEIKDISHGMLRTEVRCNSCDSHLGHVFPDGPQPSGLRYCINSVSLDFKEQV